VSVYAALNARRASRLQPLVARAFVGFKELEHPRGRDGRWIEKYGTVRVFKSLLDSGGGSSGLGRVVALEKDGAVVKTTDGHTTKYPYDRLESAKVRAFLPDAAEGRTPADAARELDDGLLKIYEMHQATQLERRARKVPPGWKNVIVSNDPEAPLQTVGIDGKGRVQRRYSADFTENQAAAKFARVQALHDVIEDLDTALAKHFMLSDTAMALMLIRRMGMRPGSEDDTKTEHKAHGATNLRAEHVTISKGVAKFDFVGKEGVRIRLESDDPQIVAGLKKRLSRLQPGDRLFKTDESKVGKFLKQHTSQDFMPKDLRTYLANVIATNVVTAMDAPLNRRQFASFRKRVAEAVSAQLGNKPEMALKSYINPTVFGLWEDALVAGGSLTTSTAALELWLSSTSFDRDFSGLPQLAPEEDDE
jgi:DNA topoisomerase IB